MNIQKIGGWLFLIAGVCIIIWSLLSSYQIFTGKTEAAQIFKTDQKIIANQSAENQTLEAQFQKIIGEQLKGMIPSDAFIKILNLSVWSLLAFILISGGGQIASLGIKLLNKG